MLTRVKTQWYRVKDIHRFQHHKCNAVFNSGHWLESLVTCTYTATIIPSDSPYESHIVRLLLGRPCVHVGVRDFNPILPVSVYHRKTTTSKYVFCQFYWVIQTYVCFGLRCRWSGAISKASKCFIRTLTSEHKTSDSHRKWRLII